MTALSSPPEFIESSIQIPLRAGWEMARSIARTEAAETSRLEFAPAAVPGTVASVLRDRAAWGFGDRVPFDDSEFWFRCSFDAPPLEPGEQRALRFGGIATISDVYLNGYPILQSDSMFAAHDVDITSIIRPCNTLLVACRSLTSALCARRGQQPWPRWRTRVAADQQLRWFRTTLLGRAPGFSPEPQPVGIWRPVTLICRREVAVEHWSREVGLDRSAGIVTFDLTLRRLHPSAMPVAGTVRVGDREAPIQWKESGEGHRQGRAIVRVPDVLPWMPHTHGFPSLYPVRVRVDLASGASRTFQDAPVGFREIDPGAQPPGDDGLAISVNGVRVFCRGVIWTPPDPVSLNAAAIALRERLEVLRDCGINLIRVPATDFYQDETFHCLCDELGLMVWQDMMFANMDYPFDDLRFHALACSEAHSELSRISRHPSLTVLCGNSEIEQQAGMLGLEPHIARSRFFGEELPTIAAKLCPGVPYIPSAPCGGDQPFRTRSGIAGYFGVGAYRRPLDDARLADVRFASECLAFANVPEPGTLEGINDGDGKSPRLPAWKRGIPRDPGADWDFEDVRNHYLALLYSSRALEIRDSDLDHYLCLSGMASGEVMAEVFGEWRRETSRCCGGIILSAGDLQPGAGWGILDYRGWPKPAYWFLKRALAGCTVWMTEEGLNGIDVHVVNEAAATVHGSLRVALYRDGEFLVEEGWRPVAMPGRSMLCFGVEEIIGRFVDASCAYRFGPPGHDLITATLYLEPEIPFAQSFRFPAGRGVERVPIEHLGVAAESRRIGPDQIEILLSSRRFSWGLRASCRGWMPDDAYFGIEPGGKRRIRMRRIRCQQPEPAFFSISAANAAGALMAPFPVIPS